MKLSALMVLAAVAGGGGDPTPTCEQRVEILKGNAVHLTTAAFMFSYNCGKEGVSLETCQENFFKRVHPEP